MGGQAGCYSWDQEASNGRIVLPTATFLLTPNLKIPDELDSYTAIHSTLSLGVSASARKVIAKSLPKRNLLYNAGFYLTIG